MNDKIVLVQAGAHRIQIGGALLRLPLQHMCLAAWLRRDDFYKDKIKIFDMRVHKLNEAVFKDSKILGISAMTGQQIKYGLQAAQLARKVNPEVIIVWGGIHPTLLPEQTVQHELVDVVVIGEGEETFREVAQAIYQGDEIVNIAGTCIQNHHGQIIFGPKRSFIDFNTMPLPAYDLVDIDDYSGIEHQFDYQSSRGCPYRCGFCYNTAFSERKWRAKKAEKVIEELEYLHKKYSVKNFALVDDESFINRKRAEEIFKGIIAKKLDFGMITSCRLDIVRKISTTSLATMKQAGLVQLFFGAESGSNETLNHIDKDITREDIESGALKVAEAGIRPILSFMSGFPGERLDQFEKTLEIIRRLWDLNPLITINGIFPFNAYPGTKLYLKSKDLGLNVPQRLEEWGKWSFQYKPDNPWLTKKMKTWMQVAFYIVRFHYYLARFEDRHSNNFLVRILKGAVLPLSISANIRLSKKWFGLAVEWKLFAYAVRKTFGYL
jgi:radical SAM superfamily enzyme YgiQ (UPF0313 family)